MNSKTQNTINERINFLLKASKMSKAAFSSRINVTRATLDNYIGGSTTPHQKNVETICNNLGVNENWLLTGNGEPFDFGGIKTPHKEQSQSSLNAEKVFDEMKEIITSQRTQIESLTKMLSKVMGVELGKAKHLELLAGHGVIIPLSVSGVDAA